MAKLDQLLKELQDSTTSLRKQVESFSEEAFHAKPGANSWSASDVIAHLYILEGFICKVLTGSDTPSEREVGEKVETIKKVFLNFEQKLNAPDMIRPKPDVVKTKEDMLEKLSLCRQQIATVLNQKELNEVCLDYIHAQFGEMTRYEWGYFVVYHSQRHEEQLKRIKQVLS